MSRVMSLKYFLAALVSATQLFAFANQPLTLKQIMSDPDWIARSPEQPYWSEDGNSVFFSQKQANSSLYRLIELQLANQKTQAVAVGSELLVASPQGSYNADRTAKVFIRDGDVFLHDLTSNQVVPLVRTHDREQSAQFLLDGSIAYRLDNSFFVVDKTSGKTLELVTIKSEAEPESWQEPKDFLGSQQRRLFDYIRQQQDEAQARKQQQQDRKKSLLSPQVAYIGKNKQVTQATLSPNGRYLFIATADEAEYKYDNMPEFVTDDGYVNNQKVRPLVGQITTRNEIFLVYDLVAEKLHQLDKSKLSGITKDPLERLKKKTAKAKGEKFTSSKQPRDIYIHNWYGDGLVWSKDGSRLGLTLMSFDNKDRWLVEIDFSQFSFVELHRLTDPAWVNERAFNEKGWMPDNSTFYYLSEESGYAHLYIKRDGKKPIALTGGNFEVSDVSLSKDGQYFYFKANKDHPGIYNVYRVDVATKALEQLTDLQGIVDYQLSPDEKKLLLSYSTRTRPPELHLQDLQSGQLTKLTATVSEQFSQIQWQAPEIVAVPSSNTNAPIYSRLYLPPNFDPNAKQNYPVVMFVHGAGYLQNAHYGWSLYFREFMFHNLLAEQGYIVLDMDYRASSGYGRDWRTAIYRQMGTPELEDLLDGKQWLVKNYNADPARVGIYGGSYGGFMTFMALFKAPGEFAAGASLRPVTDWASYNHGYTSNILNTPEVDPEAYNKSSPIEFAAGLQDPLLIAHGMVDDNVFFKDSVRLVQRLIELEKTELFETAIYPIEPHGFREPSSWLDEYTRIYNLFQEHVKVSND